MQPQQQQPPPWAEAHRAAGVPGPTAGSGESARPLPRASSAGRGEEESSVDGAGSGGGADLRPGDASSQQPPQADADIERLHLSTINAERRRFLLEGARQEAAPEAAGAGAGQGPVRERKPIFKLKFFDRAKPKAAKEEPREAEVPAAVLRAVRVERLPQQCVAKYLGRRPCKGYHGPAAVRKPVDALVDAVGRLPPGTDLPLVSVLVTERGLSAEPHPLSRGRAMEPLLLPVQSIAYAVQDAKFCRLLALVFVHEPGGRAQRPECHCFVCPTPLAARRLALALAQAFDCVARRLRGELVIVDRPAPVDVRTPDELLGELQRQSCA